jgi:hypothetical protein
VSKRPVESWSFQTRLATSTEHAHMYKVSMEEARWGAVFPGVEASILILQSTFPSFGAKSVHPSVNLPLEYRGSSAGGKCPER